MSDGDVLTVRVYRHPALGDGPDRPVVRLVAGQLGAAEDLTMSVLGFTPPERVEPVGTTTRRALGFPAWALVHDPANGRHALAIVKDLRRLARQVAGRPAAAMGGYDGLATVLGGAAPQFLPTFWEEAGRAFLAAGNVTYASTCFTRARDAEQVHALEIDEDRVADVFLEFASAGAVPVKAVSRYARDLAARSRPDEAFERFRTVTLRRVASGLPPYPALPGEIRRLATAAGRNGDDAVAELVTGLLGLPATAKSAPGTWKALRPALVRAAATRPEVRDRLLATVADPPGYDADLTDEWVDLLVATGTDTALVDAARAEDAARWLERFVAKRNWRSGRSAGLLGLVERMLPALRAAGRPVVVADGYRGDLDLVDLCLAGDVDIAWAGSFRPGVRQWIADTAPGRRDLAALAADERFAGKLGDETVDALDDPATLPVVVGSAGLREAVGGWLRDLAGRVPAAPTAAGLGRFAGRVGWVGTAATAALEPDALRRIADADVAAALTRTLNTGLLAEFGWPEYEAAVAGLTGQLRFGRSWPYLIVQDATTIVVLGPSGPVLTHPVPAFARQWHRRDAAWVPGVGRLLVWSGTERYWADAPSERHTGPQPRIRDAVAMALPDGGVTYGGAPWRPGDVEFPDRFPLAGDNTGYWSLREVDRPHDDQDGKDEDDEDGERWVPFDPLTGEVTGTGPPAFLAGENVSHAGSELLPAPAQWSASPLGHSDGLMGFRLERQPDGRRLLTRVDGRQLLLPPAGHVDVAGALAFPGTDSLCRVVTGGSWPDFARIEVHTPDDQFLDAVDAGPELPRAGWLHACRVRDAAGSAALRSVGVDAVRALLASTVDAVDALAARRDGGPAALAAAEQELADHVDAAVTGAITGVTDPVLRRAVARHTREAAELTLRLREITALTGAAPVNEATAPVSVTLDEDTVRAVTDPLDQHSWLTTDDVVGAVAQVAALPAVLAATAGSAPWPSTDLDWAALLGQQAALVALAAAPVARPTERAVAVALLTLLRDSGFATGDGTVRALHLDAGPHTFTPPQVVRTGPRTMVVLGRIGYAADNYVAVERDPTGVFGPVEGATVSEDRRSTFGGAAYLDAVLARLAADGPPPWRPELVAELADRTGMSRSTAALLLAGMPGVSTDLANFLDREVRATLALSVAEAQAGRANLRAVDEGRHRDLFAAMLPADPGRLWTSGPDVDRLAAVWADVVGSRPVVPDDVLAEARKARRYVDIAATITDLAGDPDRLRPGRSTAAEATEGLGDVGFAITWLAYRLPPESPLRAVVADRYDRVRAVLADPATNLDLGYLEEGTPIPPSLVVEEPDEYATVVMYTARITGPDDPALAMFPDDNEVDTVRRLLDPGVAELMDELRRPAAGWPQDPTVSVPEVVAEVADRHGIGADPAAYYLQVLALGDPTDRNVRRWTGWTPARIGTARARLVAAGLVVEAKRTGAGRSAFLPGGWSTTVGVEEWKFGHLGAAVGRDDLSAPGRPVGALFRTAWRRVLDGDPPRLREFGGPTR